MINIIHIKKYIYIESLSKILKFIKLSFKARRYKFNNYLLLMKQCTICRCNDARKFIIILKILTYPDFYSNFFNNFLKLLEEEIND